MAKRPTKPRKPPAALVSASITYQESAARYGSTQVLDREMVARGVVNCVYSAANINATTCSSQTIRLYRKASGGSKLWPGVRVKDRRRLAYLRGELKTRPNHKALAMSSAAENIEEVLEHPALNLVYAPDTQMPGTSWWWLFFFFGETAGRAYVYKGERSGGVPVSLYMLAPMHTKIVADKRQGITAYTYGVEATDEVTYPAEDVLYHRLQPNPFRPIQAMSWLASVRLQSDLEQAAIQSEIARWNNGGNPSMVLELGPDTTDEQRKQTESYIRSRYTGVNKSGAVMVLQNAKINAAGNKPNEMQYIEGGKRSEELIYRAAGIPEPIWRMNDSNRASAIQADPQYMSQTILPRLNATAELLTEGLLSEWGGEMWFAYDNPVAEDRKAEVDEVTVLTDKGILTGNEGRQLLGYDTAGPELDVHRYMGTSLATKDAPPPSPFGGTDAEAEETGDEVPGSDDGDAGSGDGDSGGGAEGTGDDDAGGKGGPHAGDSPKPVPVAVPVHPATVGAGQAELTWAKWYDPCPCGCGSKARVDALATEAELAKYMEDWYSRAITTIGPDGRPNLTELSRELNQTISRMMGEIFAQGGTSMTEQLGGDPGSFSVMSDDAVRYVNEHAGRLVSGITETVRTQVANAVNLAVEQGRPLTEVQGALRNAGFAENRAEVVARTESINAYNAGQFQGAKDLGVEQKTYDLSANPCEACMSIAAANTSPKPLTEPFAKAGETYAGVTLSRDVMWGSEVHPQCSCGFTPVLGD